MAIKVQSANNTIKVGVSTDSSAGSVQATYDSTEYYSNLARDWAIKMDGKVQEEDYSSKYYAQQSSYSADNAMELVAGFDEHVANKTNNFDQHAQSKIDEAEIWAEGTDEQVQALGGEHSAKGWAEQALSENITTQGNEFNLANQLVQLDSEGRLPSIDGSKLFNLQAYTEAETDLLLKDKQDKLTAGANITIDENNVISAIGGESDVFGIKGDYSTRYGIIDCPNGLASYAVGTKDVTFAAGIVLIAPNNDTKITMASEYTYSILGTEDVALFYVAGDIVEVHSHDVFWQTHEPENGETGYLAWWNGEKWQFKSNDTGNVWRTAIAQPLVNVKILDDVVIRLDYIGYRILDDEIIAMKKDLETKADKNVTLNLFQTNNCILEAPNGVATFSGSTITAKQGLKLLVSNGRNQDETLNNTIYTLQEDLEFTYPFNINIPKDVVFINIATQKIVRLQVEYVFYVKTYSDILTNTGTNAYRYAFVEDDNKWYYLNPNNVDWVEISICEIARCSINSQNIISNLTTSNTLTLLNFDNQGKIEIDSLSKIGSKYIELTPPPYTVNTFVNTEYVAASNGWVSWIVNTGASSSSTGYLALTVYPIADNTKKSVIQGKWLRGMAGNVGSLLIPVSKGDRFVARTNCSQAPSANVMTFWYDKGSESEAV